MNVGCDTLLSAVQMGDTFVTTTTTIYPYHLSLPYQVEQLHPETQNLARDPVPRVYSKELAYVAVSLAYKAFEEDFSLKLCVVALENNYLVKMEWEVFTTLQCVIPRSNLGTWMADLLPYASGHLSHTFHRLALAIALDAAMLRMSPATIVLACKLLHRRGCFRPQVESRQIFLIRLFMGLARNYEVSMGAIMREYTALHRDAQKQCGGAKEQRGDAEEQYTALHRSDGADAQEQCGGAEEQ
jgi:hypothetical protein